MAGEYSTLIKSVHEQSNQGSYESTQTADIANGRDPISGQKEMDTGLKGSPSVTEADKDSAVHWTVALKRMWRDFAKTTSLNGVVFIVKHTHKVGRILWCLIVAMMFTFLVATITNMCQRYFSYSHVTTIEVNRQYKIDFPAVTLCLKSPFDHQRLKESRHHDIIESYLTAISALPFATDVARINWTDAEVTSILKNWTFGALLDHFSLGLRDILLYGKQTNTTSANAMLDPQDHFIVEDLKHTRCFTYNAAYKKNATPLQMNEMEMLYLLLNVPQSLLLPQAMTPGIWVSLHDPAERAMPFGLVDVAPGSSVEIRFVLKEYKFLPAPYNSFNNRDCVDTKAGGFKSPLAFSDHYTWAGCVLEAARNYSSRDCSCVVSDGAGPHGLPVCDLYTGQTCFRPQQEKEMLRQLSGMDGTCLPLCNNRQFAYSWSAVPFPSDAVFQALKRANLTKGTNPSDLIELKLKLDTSLVTTTKHIPAYTADDVYSTLGGEMGLFLGASMLTVIEIIEIIGLSIWTLIKTLFQAR